jgi:hypothetical protein
MPQEDRAPIGFEEDHRVVDQAGQDLVEVETAADVACDPAKGIRPMKLVGDLVGRAPGPNDSPDLAGNGPQEIPIPGGRVRADAGGDDEDAPGPAVDRDRDCELRSGARNEAGPVSSDHWCRIGKVTLDRKTHRPEVAWQLNEMEIDRAGRGPRDESVSAKLEDCRRQMGPVIEDGAGRFAERGVSASYRCPDPAQFGKQVEVGPAAFAGSVVFGLAEDRVIVGAREQLEDRPIEPSS